MTKVLAITHLGDAHIPFLQSHLDEEIVIFDPSQFPFNTDITYELNKGRFLIFSRDICFNTVDAVWYRKPIYLQPHQFQVAPEYREFAQKSYDSGVKAIYDLLGDKFWVSNVRNIARASNKLYQLEIASDFGFKIPETLVTSSAQHAAEFRRRHGGIVTKSLVFQPVTLDDGELYILYATRIPKEADVDFSGLCLTPTIFQAEVPKVADTRVTVVGQDVFPCRIIRTGSLENEVDWRVGMRGSELRYETDLDFPKSLQEKCVGLTQALGLQCSAIDFAETEDRDYWFLEINPNGQWGFIEERTRLPIAASMAALFRRNSS